MSIKNYRDIPMEEKLHVFLDVSIDDIKYGRVVIELFKDHVPKTAENFRALCTGERGVGGLNCPLHYKNSVFHKAVPGCIVQGGDITNHDGTGGESIYGPYFEDESLIISHSEEGLLSMANCGFPNSNNSQFCVTLGKVTHLDGKYVVFGRVLKGFSVINEISCQLVGPGDRPESVCKIWDCGELKEGQDWGYCDRDYRDVYPPYPKDWELPLHYSLEVDDIVDTVEDIKDAGNRLLKEGNAVYAHQKYKKAMRYLDWYLKNHADKASNDKLSELRNYCHLNAALACIKVGRFREAIEHCNGVPGIQSNAKCLYRRGIAKEKLNDHQEALADLNAALQLAPEDRAILSEISRINQFLLKYKQSERIQCSRMFRM